MAGVGTLVRVTDKRMLASGRMILKAVGEKRFKVLSLDSDEMEEDFAEDEATAPPRPGSFSSNAQYPDAQVAYIMDSEEEQQQEGKALAQATRDSFVVLHDKYIKAYPEALANFFLQKLYKDEFGLLRPFLGGAQAQGPTAAEAAASRLAAITSKMRTILIDWLLTCCTNLGKL